MTQPSESGTPVGGIGTMLMQSDVCPACGKVHGSRMVRYLPTVEQFGGAPTLAPTAGAIASARSSSARVRGRKPSGMPVLWPMPQASEGYP
ncbi:MAG TPA: hypothetical protein VGX00_00895 [Thermoplasmata archaeon]|nr:hypothetical protein [Thermoplasmata archaeon]